MAVAALLGACSGDDGDGGTDALPSDTTSTTSTTVVEDQEAAEALAVWQEYVVAADGWLDPPNPAHPRIAEFIAAEALEGFREGIARDLAQRIATRPGPGGPTEHRPRVTSSTPSEVVIRDCFVDDSVGYDLNTGEVVDDAVVTLTIDVTLVPEGSTWKIRQISEVERQNGAARCD